MTAMTTTFSTSGNPFQGSCTIERARRIAGLFDYTDDDVRKCVAEFVKEMNDGLRERTPAMCQIPTYVTRVANGMEKGLSLAVDLGGTNLRVCSVDLHGDTTFNTLQSKMTIPRELMVASAAELFSFITSHIEAFLKTHHSDCFNPSETKRPFSLGLVFSYPVYQNAINQGILLRWTKGFDIPDVVGQDVCKLLQNELDLRNLPVRVTALVNDAAGTIMSRAYSLPLSKTRTSIGAIFGTGTNGVYLEKLSKITKPLDGHYDTSTGEMFISVEWGSFNNHLSVLPNTPYDAELNAVSVNPGNQMFEKRVSGMFLGELLRTITLEMHMDPNFKLFQVLDSHTALADEERLAFFTRWAVDSSLLSAAEADSSDGLKTLREKIAESFGLPIAVISLEDAQVVKIIANAIGRRAARLAGMAIGAVVLQSGRLNDPVTPLTAGTETKQWLSIDKSLSRNAPTPTPEEGDGYGDDFREFEIVDVGVDGSLIEFYPGFEAYMREALRAIAGIGTAGEKRVRIGIAKDGSSVGAAIIALLAGEQLRNDGN